MLRVAVGSVVHEANTFTPARISWDDIAAGTVLTGPSVIEQAPRLDNAVPGFLRQGGVEWAPLTSVAIPGAGKLTAGAFERLLEEFAGRLRAAGPVDACLVSIGGGMVADRDDLEDADGVLLSALREALPAGARLGAALDMHANVSDRMLAAADVMLAFQTFPPHWDKAEIGARVARLVTGAARGEVSPVMAVARPPMLVQPEAQDTGRWPMREVMAAAEEARGIPGILGVSMIPGFAWCDVPEAGASVVVVADGDVALARRVAADQARRWFEMRDAFRVPLTPLPDAAERAAAHRGPPPMLLCEGFDNPGAGGAGDSTALLEALLDRGVRAGALAALCDPAAVAACFRSGEGARVDLELGGRRDPVHGRPLPVSGVVRKLSDGRYANRGPLWPGAAGDLGRAATLTVGGIDVVVTERPNGAYDPAVFEVAGIRPAEKSVLVVKSQIFGPRAFGGLVAETVIVDGDGWATSDFRRLPYRRLRRPIFPLDSGVEFAPQVGG